MNAMKLVVAVGLLAAVTLVRAKQADMAVALPARKAPPVIIIKLDDVTPANGKAREPFKKMAEFFQERRLKASFGVICHTLEEENPEYEQWIKQVHAAGWIEFWFHGFDHHSHDVNGVALMEFNQRPYADQRERFDKSQKLALKKLGFVFTTFGAPGSGTGAYFDDVTYRVMQDEPHMKVWLYPRLLDEAGKKLEAAGKVVILDRVSGVNLERVAGVVDYDKFMRGYAAHPERDYFVLQGHPCMWGRDNVSRTSSRSSIFWWRRKRCSCGPLNLPRRNKEDFTMTTTSRPSTSIRAVLGKTALWRVFTGVSAMKA